MCGISGALTVTGATDINELVLNIVRSQTPRGPDAQGVCDYRAGSFRAVLGHNRLSIIDLSDEANQPMQGGDGRLHVVFNGEIYNYLELREELAALGARFRTRSDTEVVLEAYRHWGSAAFDRFIGMFAIAIYDCAAEEMVLARDRFGVKPLYYWSDGSTLAFASTPTVLASFAGAAPNLEYLARGIRYKYYEDETDFSPYLGVPALEPAHLLRIRVEGGRIRSVKERYYDLAGNVEGMVGELAGLSYQQLEERLKELLRSACLLRQRSDVPIGLSVSGGVDSSTVAALLSETLDRVVGYSYGHEDAPESEGPLVAELGRASRLQPRWVWLERGDQVVELFWRTLAAQDAPFPHASVMAQHAVFQAARADGIKVLLGGQGGDEAFMGYRKYYLFYALSILRGKKFALMPHFLSAVLPFVPAVARRAGMFFSERKRYSGSSDGMGTRLLLPASTRQESMGLGALTTRQRQMLDVTRFSLPTLLRYEDRNSMGNSIESRLPFLDHRLIEFGVALAEQAKLGNGFGKWILRRSMQGKLPDSIRLNRDKRGFDVNQQRWISQGLGAALREALRERRSAVAQWLPRDADLDRLFCDEALGQHPQAFKEAVSLIWLGGKL